MKTAIGALCLAAAVGQSPLPQQPVFRGGTDLVTLDVAVHRRNAPVTGLTAREFEITDNGVRQQAELDVVDHIPVDVTLVVNLRGRSPIPIDPGTRIDATEVNRIVAALATGDRLRVLTFASDVREAVPMQPVGTWDRQQSVSQKLTFPRNSALDGWHVRIFDALLLALARPPEAGRQHLIVGYPIDWDSSSVADGAALAIVASRSQALLSVAIDPYMTNGGPVGWANDFAGFPWIAYTRDSVVAAVRATGGEVRETSRGGGVAAARSILADFRKSYVLRYARTGVAPGGWHALAVTVPGHPEYTVRARPGYFGG